MNICKTLMLWSYISALIIISACEESSETDLDTGSRTGKRGKFSEFDTSGFHKVQPEQLEEDSNFAAAFTLEQNVYHPGDVFLAKIFLANNTLYDKKETEPDIRFVHQRRADYPTVLSEGKYAPIVDDTGYVRFVVKDPGIQPGDTILTSWTAFMGIPLEGRKDTLFGYMQRFLVTK